MNIIEQVQHVGQGHILRFLDQLSDVEKEHLLTQIKAIDFNLLDRLIKEQILSSQQHEDKRFESVGDRIVTMPRTREEERMTEEAKQIGQTALRQGKIAYLLVAGGQGSRLGFNGPKGSFKIGPVSGKSLFQIYAERILAINQRYNLEVPWYIMTNPINHPQTYNLFQQNNFFGLQEDKIHFFEQMMMMPSVDFNGRLLMQTKDTLFMNPPGNGVCISLLKKNGFLEDMKGQGIEHIFYFQVDNALANITDPAFIGYHILNQSDVSTKVIAKTHPEEKMGVIGQVNGRFGIIEYTELSKEQMYAKERDGRLRFWAGTIGIYLFRLDFMERVADNLNLPFHKAIKAIPYLDESGQLIHPDRPNGIKFETFIFDFLPQAKHALAVEVNRSEEYSPLKNREGEHSPEIVKRDLVNLYASWLESAGIDFKRKPNGQIKGLVEISPLFALDRESFVERVDKSLIFNRELYLE